MVVLRFLFVLYFFQKTVEGSRRQQQMIYLDFSRWIDLEQVNKPNLNSLEVVILCNAYDVLHKIPQLLSGHYITFYVQYQQYVVGHNLNPCKLYMIQLAKSMFHSITLNTSNCQFGRQRIKAFCHYRFNEYIQVIMTALLLWIHTDTTVRNQDTGPIIKKDIEMYRINVLIHMQAFIESALILQ